MASIEVEEYNFKTKSAQKAIVECNVWGQAAQTLTNYGGPGSIISGSGRISPRDYTNPTTGKTSHFQDIVLEKVEILYSPSVPMQNRAPGYSLVTPTDDDSSSW